MVLEKKLKSTLVSYLGDLKNALMSMSIESLKDEFLDKIFQGSKGLKVFENLTMPMVCHYIAIVKDEFTYDKFIPKSYKDSYPYEVSKDALPWLVVNYDQKLNGIGSAGLAVSIYKDGVKCTIANVTGVGTLTEDDTILVLSDVTLHNLFFDIAQDLGLDKTKLEGTYTVEFMKCTATTEDETTTYTFAENQFFDLKY